MAKQTKTAMQQALESLFAVGGCAANDEQIAAAAAKFEVEVWKLEGFYFDEIDRIAAE